MQSNPRRGGRGYSGINVKAGPTEPNILHPKKYVDVILCTQKNTRLEILEILHADYSNHAFRSCRNSGLNCVRTISLAEIRTQKNTCRFFRHKKNTWLNLQPQNNTGVENFKPKKIRRTPPPPSSCLYPSIPPGSPIPSRISNPLEGEGGVWISIFHGANIFTFSIYFSQQGFPEKLRPLLT